MFISFCDVSFAKDIFKSGNEYNKICIEQMLNLVIVIESKTQKFQPYVTSIGISFLNIIQKSNENTQLYFTVIN